MLPIIITGEDQDAENCNSENKTIPIAMIALDIHRYTTLMDTPFPSRAAQCAGVGLGFFETVCDLPRRRATRGRNGISRARSARRRRPAAEIGAEHSWRELSWLRLFGEACQPRPRKRIHPWRRCGPVNSITLQSLPSDAGASATNRFARRQRWLIEAIGEVRNQQECAHASE